MKMFAEAMNIIIQVQLCFKKQEIKLELFTNIDTLQIVEKGIRGGICYAIHQHAKANNKYLKGYNKNKELSNFMNLDATNLYGWAISQNLPVKERHQILMKRL